MTDRFERQADLVPVDRLAIVHPVVVGLGAIGRPLALQLTAIGASRITLIDFDVVEEVNLPTQGYREKDLGALKIDATADILREISSLEITKLNLKFEAKMLRKPSLPVVFACVDSIEVREEIARACRAQKVQLLVDGRMLGETMRILTATANPDTYGHYMTTLFKREEAAQGRCTARSTIYCATIAAGLMVHQFTRWLKGLIAPDKDIMLELAISAISSPSAASGPTSPENRT